VFHFPLIFGTSTSVPQLLIFVATKEKIKAKLCCKFENGIEPFVNWYQSESNCLIFMEMCRKSVGIEPLELKCKV
jgi:hypothetical protein